MPSDRTVAAVVAGLLGSAFLLWAIGQALVGSPARLPCVKLLWPRASVLLVGDSIGVGLEPVLRRLAEVREVAFASIVLEGTTIRHWSRDLGLRATMGLTRPSLVIAVLGTNDAVLDRPESERQDLQSLLSLLSMGGQSFVVWVEPPSTSSKLTSRSRVLAMLPADGGVFRRFRGAEAHVDMSPDGLHPTGSGYIALGNALWTWMLRGACG